MKLDEYQSYRGLPSVAGICSIEEAMKPGLPVEECVRRHKRYHYAWKRLHQTFTARITAEPIYELKMAFSLHAHLCAEHARAVRERVEEMREPPHGLDAVPDPNLEIFFDEILAAPTTAELLLGIYEKAIPALQGALLRHLADTNLMVDHPSVRICRFALLELADIRAFGEKAVPCMAGEATREQVAEWLGLLDECLLAAGGLDGADAPGAKQVSRCFSAKPYVYDRKPKRDERFADPYNMAVNAEVFLHDPSFPPQPKTLMLFYRRLREIDVPEMMASILTETPGKPWDYYRDMTRQLWDEARHAMMGEIGLLNLGVDWRKVMINFTWSLELNTQLEAWERHAVLYYIEQGLMPKSGKRFEWEVAVESGNPLAALFQDYDWADEVLHAQIGRLWYVPAFNSQSEALSYGDKCWSKVLVGWRNWMDQGLTQHRNWWPEVYRDACKSWGAQPDPRILSYAETYENTRADLRPVSG